MAPECLKLVTRQPARASISGEIHGLLARIAPRLTALYSSAAPLLPPLPARTCSQQLLRSTEASWSLACLCSRRVRSEPELVLGIPHTRTCALHPEPSARPP
ncbi:hypothetical protein ACQJBY_033528 [Aegilops geniculata]